MRMTVYKLLQEAQQKMNGYAVYMNYQFMHFGVKAEPAALLTVEVEVGGERMNLEEVADVALPQDDQFALIPKDRLDSQGTGLPVCHLQGCDPGTSRL